jgi:hypothetical protein
LAVQAGVGAGGNAGLEDFAVGEEVGCHSGGFGRVPASRCGTVTFD